MTKSQYYKWRSKLRQVHGRQQGDHSWHFETIKDVCDRMFPSLNERQKQNIIDSCNGYETKFPNVCLSYRLTQYKLKKRKERDPLFKDVVEKIEESQAETLKMFQQYMAKTLLK